MEQHQVLELVGIVVCSDARSNPSESRALVERDVSMYLLVIQHLYQLVQSATKQNAYFPTPHTL